MKVGQSPGPGLSDSLLKARIYSLLTSLFEGGSILTSSTNRNSLSAPQWQRWHPPTPPDAPKSANHTTPNPLSGCVVLLRTLKGLVRHLLPDWLQSKSVSPLPRGSVYLHPAQPEEFQISDTGHIRRSSNPDNRQVEQCPQLVHCKFDMPFSELLVNDHSTLADPSPHATARAWPDDY
ncbi:hypothetical protein [Pseudomonas palleroniana]|uniref:hypothetical protein n=1 Tax=Pseudomonas palleroniana TaxID=191390 RepID=UPI0013563BE9|nr:hypothetical protein [Pseudomonas palleroniana]